MRNAAGGRRAGPARLVLLIALACAVWAQDRLTLDDLTYLVRNEKDQTRIIQLIRQSELELRPQDLPALREAGAGPELLKVLEELLGKPSGFSLDEVVRMLREMRPEEEILDFILAAGEPRALTVRQKLDLGRAGASENVIRALEGDYVPPGFAVFKPDHRLFSIHYPKEWYAYQWYTAEGFKVVLSPERGIPAPNKFTTGLQLQVYTLWQGSPKIRFGAYEGWKRELPTFLRLNRSYGIRPLPGKEGEPVPIRLAGREAVRQKFAARMMDTPCTEILAETVAQDLEFFMEFVAPEKEFAEHEETFWRMLRSFRPFPDEVRTTRLREPLDASDLVDRYRESVVHVRAYFSVPDGQGGVNSMVGMGTGFFVREDGYVLTNCHVVCRNEDLRECNIPGRALTADRYEIVWDSAVGPKASGQKHRTAEATLIAIAYDDQPRVDLALLKVPPGPQPYRAMPLAATGRARPTGLVKEGDPVLALGFPLPGRFGIDRLTQTGGSCSKLHYYGRGFGEDPDAGKLDYIMTDLVINKGNSGGPLVSRVTGAAIALNTWFETARKGEAGVEGERLGYAFSVPIDHVYHYFPQIRFYPLYKELPPEGHLELGAMLLQQRNLRAARTELARAHELRHQLNPKQRANLLYEFSRYFAELRQTDEAKQMLLACLQENADHVRALVDLAYYEPADRLDKSIGYIDRAIQAQPDDWSGLFHRAEFYRRAGRPEDALLELKRAREEFGAGEQTDLLRLEGLLYFESGKLDEGLASYRKAVEVDPGDVAARLGVADYYVRKGNTQAALLEYGRLAREHEEDPLVRETFGRFLRGQAGREQEGLGHMIAAVNLALAREESPGPALLRDLSAMSRAGEENFADSIAAALLLHEHWPGWRGTAHRSLAAAWTEKQREGLATAHHRAADRAFATDGSEPATAPGSPLTLDEVNLMVQAGYSADLFSETLFETSLGFSFVPTDESVGQLLQAGWTPWHLQTTLRKAQLDQLLGSEALGAQIGVEYEGFVQITDEGSWSIIKVTNNTSVPLTGFQVRLRYYEKKNDDEEMSLLREYEQPLALPFGYLAAGETRAFRLDWHGWETLKRAGVDKSRVTNWSVAFESARHAGYLNGATLEGGFDKDGTTYRFRVRNDGAYPLRGLRVRCDFVGEDDRVLLRTTGSSKGEPGYDARLLTDLTLAPGETSGDFTIKEWGLADFWRRLGLPADKVKAVRVQVVDAEPVLGGN